MPPPEAARRAVALDHDGLRAAQREAAAGLGRDVAAGLLRARVRAPMGRTLWIEVRGPKTDDDDRLVARSVQALLPRGMRVRPAGLRGERSLLHVEAPVGYEGELLALLQERVADPGGGPPPLLFEGFSPDGSPRFAAVQLDVSEEE